MRSCQNRCPEKKTKNDKQNMRILFIKEKEATKIWMKVCAMQPHQHSEWNTYEGGEGDGGEGEKDVMPNCLRHFSTSRRNFVHIITSTLETFYHKSKCRWFASVRSSVCTAANACAQMSNRRRFAVVSAIDLHQSFALWYLNLMHRKLIQFDYYYNWQRT